MEEEEERVDATGGRILSAAGASVVAALVVNPLDVIKTRIQAQAAVPKGLCPESTLYEQQRRFYQGAGGVVRPDAVRWSFAHCTSVLPTAAPNRKWAVTSCPQCATGNGHTAYTSMYDALRKIVRQEGVPVLWRGMSASLMLSVPMVGIYMPLYEYMMGHWSQPMGNSAPVVAGSLARAIAVFCVAPFELIRTRLQATRPHHGPVSVATHLGLGSACATASTSGGGAASVAASALSALRLAPNMWTGVSATLWRDVPFSALYWGTLEPLRDSLLPPNAREQHLNRQIVLASMAAGAVAGGSAAAVTTPFDVVKTRHQIRRPGAPRTSVLSTMGDVWRAEGMAGLFRGVAPRSARAAPACAIVISVYEMLKVSLGQ